MLAHRLRGAVVAVATAALVVPLGVTLATSASAAPVDLALGKPVTASSQSDVYAPGNVTDGSTGTYWESQNNAFPQWVQIDLGSAQTVESLGLNLPPGWGDRTQTVLVQGSADGSSFTTLKGAATYSFTQSASNAVEIDTTDASVRYVRLTVTTNSGWPAAQLSEVRVLGSTGSGTGDPGGSNLAQGRPIVGSSTTQGYVAANAVDGSRSSYWEAASAASTLDVTLAAPSDLTAVNVLLNPDAAWGARTQTFAVLGRTGSSGSWTTIKPSATYAFAPSSGNQVAVPVTAAASEVRLQFSGNTGATGAQVAELQVIGTPSSTPTAPDLQVSLLATSPSAPTTTTPVTLSANVRNAGTGAATATTVVLTVDGTTAATVAVPALAAGASTTVTAVVGTRAAGTHAVVATVDPAGAVTESDESNNTATGSFTVSPDGVPVKADLVVQGLTTMPASPTTADVITLGATVRNQGTGASAATTVAFAVAGQQVGTATVPALAVGASSGVTLTLGTRAAGTYTLGATVDPTNVVAESDEGNNSATGSVTVTAGPTGGDPVDLTTHRPATASSSVGSLDAAKATDGDTATYWEGGSGAYPGTLAVTLASVSTLQQVTVKLPPSDAWGPRTQTFSVEARTGTGSWTTIAASKAYAFTNATASNSVTFPVTGSGNEVRLSFTGNTGAGNGQVAELVVVGVPAPNPDLVVTSVATTPTAPTAADAVTATVVVRNTGNLAASATTVDVLIDGAATASAAVPALAAGASATVTASLGKLASGSYTLGAKVDPAGTVVEKDETNNVLTSTAALVVTDAPGPDLQVIDLTTSPANPAVGAAVSFTVQVKNRGTTAVAAGTVTRVTIGSTTLNGTTPAIAAGATVTVAIAGTWTATSGGATATATADATNVVAETNEANNTLATAIVVGRGAAAPFTSYEAENGTTNGTVVRADAERTFGHTNFATESSGRASVRLDAQGQYVQFTSTVATNSIVVRNSIPDANGGQGQEKTISLYANGTFVQKLTLSSHYSWLYGTTDQPEGLTNTPGGDARRLFDESHALLARSYPVGTVFRLQRDAGDDAAFYYIDLVDLEQVAPALTQPAGCVPITQYGAVPNDGIDDSAAIQAAVTADQNGQISCVWIPAGQWRQEKKILTVDPQHRGTYNQVGISDVTIRGAGMWYSQLYSLTEPQDANTINHPHEGNFGFDIDKNVTLSDIAIFGSGRIRGGDGNAEGGVGLNGRFGTGTSISNVWIEHANVAVWVGRDYDNIPDLWGPADGLQFSGMRIRDTYADGINFSNGTRNSRVFNSTFRTTGDDSLAMWANPYVKDRTVDNEHDNHFVNNTIALPWRANGIAIYGGSNNSIENNLVSDTMNYPGIMLATDHSPLPFGGTTLIANNGLYRTGGAFWNEDQEFGAITLFPSTLDITGVTIRDTDIDDSTYDGIQFKNGGGNMPGVKITNVRIDRSNNGSGILAMSGARGDATLTNVTITRSRDGDVLKEPGSQFVLTGTTS
ncbi:CARDB domain-containing protein [Cellulomonas sp. HZM]|uniref:CARDB domain-containing protein n=1 Tax=Cellulomonas sp. HZM TaxID=1454010 RepID=UPI000A4B611B|nr:CARDB domain-containing protein [Cellulomonas sp. HZM]